MGEIEKPDLVRFLNDTRINSYKFGTGTPYACSGVWSNRSHYVFYVFNSCTKALLNHTGNQLNHYLPCSFYFRWTCVSQCAMQWKCHITNYDFTRCVYKQNTKKGVYQRIFTPKTPIVQWTYTGICDNLKA